MKGIILAGGSGTRLHPLTLSVSKQLLPVNDKPMIYYPLSLLMLMGIRDIMIITTPHDQDSFSRLLSNGAFLGMNFTYAVQENPNGIAEAFIIGKDFIGGDDVCLILGDNIFFGDRIKKLITSEASSGKLATIYAYHVEHPENFGVVELDINGNVIALNEKPEHPKSNLAVTGLYIYDSSVTEVAKSISPSARGELEITAVNQFYLDCNELHVCVLGRGITWLDSGTHASLMQAGQLVHAIENTQGLKIACIEEIAFTNGWIAAEDLLRLAENLKGSSYGKYLKKFLKLGLIF